MNNPADPQIPETPQHNVGATEIHLKSDSPKDKTPKSLSERLKEAPGVLSSIPRVFSLVWNANPRLTLIIMLSEVILGLVPLANVWVFKILFDSVPALISAATEIGRSIKHPIPFNRTGPAVASINCLSACLVGILLVRARSIGSDFNLLP